MTDDVRELARQIFADGVYRDGNSVSRGHTYQPLPVGDFSPPSHKAAAVLSEHRAMVGHLDSLFIKPETILDLCCNVGYHAVRLAQRYDAYAVGVESEPRTYRLARQVVDDNDVHGVHFLNQTAQDYVATSRDDFDLCVFLNAHMWVHKQGVKGLNEVMTWLAAHCYYMFFQTSHAESSGMYVIRALKNLQEVRHHLESYGWEADLIHTSGHHGGPRGLFFCRSHK